MRHFTTSDFDFALPPELIAQHPATERSASRLLDGRAGIAVDRIFRELPSLLQAGDLLVFNDTQVVKARLFGEKPTGGKVELLIERVLQGREVVAHIRVSKKPLLGTTLRMAGGFGATLRGRWPDDQGPLFRFELSDDPYTLMEQHGHVPLPPYIEHSDTPDDVQRYQTVFAKHPGAVAAPTAALHFDEAVLQALDARAVERASVTLHVGAGTFQPVKAENIADHVMHFERYAIPQATVDAIAQCRVRQGRVVAVGTTTVRTLESWAQSGQTRGDTNIFITPGFQFQVVDLLLTNFHLPKSTLMMLVSAFAGYAHTMALYQHAIAQRYRFFSYGDAMLLQRSSMSLGASGDFPVERKIRNRVIEYLESVKSVASDDNTKLRELVWLWDEWAFGSGRVSDFMKPTYSEAESVALGWFCQKWLVVYQAINRIAADAPIASTLEWKAFVSAVDSALQTLMIRGKFSE